MILPADMAQDHTQNNTGHSGVIKKFLGKIDREVLFWGALIAGSSIFILGWFAILGNADQPYHDIIIENTARFGSNKTIEVQLLYTLIFGGSLLCLLWHFFAAKQKPIVERRNLLTESLGFWVCGILVILIARYVTYERPHQLLLILTGMGLLYWLYRRFFEKDLLLPSLSFAFISFYAIVGGYRLYVFIGGEKNFSVIYALVAAFVLLVLVLFIRGNRRRHIGRAILLAQMFLPCLFLFLLQDKYRHGAKLIIIEAPLPVKIFTAAIVAVCLLEAVYKLRLYWKTPEDLDRLIGLGACMSLAAFNRFSGSGAIMPWDMHHPYENVIAFQQIFQLGQFPYKEFIPISGMYSIVHGAFVKFFGNDLFSNYFVSTNIFFTCFIIISVLLLGKRLRPSYLLFVSVYLYLTDYNRTIFVLPLLLLLSWPRLIVKKGMWLQIWLFSSFLHGLHYPLQGAAVGVGFLPLALWQSYTYIKSGRLHEDSRKLSFYIGWFLCLLPIIASTPILIGAVKHTLALSSQTVLADGISRFAQILPDFFLPFVKNHPVIRSTCYLMLTFLTPALYVWVALYLTLKVGGIRLVGHCLRIDRAQEACICLALAIMPPIVYTFSIMRLDAGATFARHCATLLAGAVMLIVLAYRYVEGKRFFYALCSFAFFIPSLSIYTLGPTQLPGKMNHCYYVHRSYVYVHDDSVPRLGRGFMRPNEYKQIQKFWQLTRGWNKEQSYLVAVPSYGYFYLCDIKGAGPAVMGAIKSYRASLELIEYVRDNKAVIGTYYNPITSYYFHNWLLTSGEYYYDETAKLFFHNDGKYEHSEVLALNKKVSGRGLNGAHLLAYASAMGSSMDNLAPNFSDAAIELRPRSGEKRIEYDLSKEIGGEEADFIYLEFADPLKRPRQVQYDYFKGRFVPQGAGPIYKYFTMTHYNWGRYITVSWVDDEGKRYKQRCEMSKGKLLIPLGAGGGWLLNKHSSLTVTADDWGKAIAVPPIKEVKLLKLRQLPHLQVGDKL